MNRVRVTEDVVPISISKPTLVVLKEEVSGSIRKAISSDLVRSTSVAHVITLSGMLHQMLVVQIFIVNSDVLQHVYVVKVVRRYWSLLSIVVPLPVR